MVLRGVYFMCWDHVFADGLLPFAKLEELLFYRLGADEQVHGSGTVASDGASTDPVRCR